MVLVDVAAEQALELAQTLKFSHQQRPRRADEEALALAAEAKGVAAVGARECNVLHGCQCHPTPAESREFRKVSRSGYFARMPLPARRLTLSCVRACAALAAADGA